jgi:hypothetical protein
VRHIPDGVLRRLDDERLAVPDRVIEHAADCELCSTRRAQIAQDRERAAQLLSAPQLVVDIDEAWARLQPELHRSSDGAAERRRPAAVQWRAPRFRMPSLRSGLAIGAVGIAVVGTAAAATLTTIFAPTHVAPVSVSQNDVRALAAFIGVDSGHVLGGFGTPSGSTSTRFGSVKWSSSGRAHAVSSLADATAQVGFPVVLPTHLPAGVGAVREFVVQPRVSATVTFNGTAGRLAGTSVTLQGGPGFLAQYGAANGTQLPALAVAALPRPTARSSGASLNQLEAFLLAQPGIPPGLAEEVRLLGDLRTTLPVPVPKGASVNSVQVAGSPGVLLTDSSNAAAGVVWEDGRGMLHVVAGILDSHDVLNVADQLG